MMGIVNTPGHCVADEFWLDQVSVDFYMHLDKQTHRDKRTHGIGM